MTVLDVMEQRRRNVLILDRFIVVADAMLSEQINLERIVCYTSRFDLYDL
jgi:hypothetical protein